MLVALISYILLNIYLARAKSQSDGEIDEGRKAEMVAKVSKIIGVINHVVAIWFKFLLLVAIIVFIAAIVALAISIFGISAESTWVTSFELWNFGTISHIVGEHGLSKVITTILALLVLLMGLSSLAVWLLTNKKLWKKRA